MSGRALPLLAGALALSVGVLSAAAAAAQAPPVSPADFVSAAGGADGYEVMAGRVALVEARDPAIRRFAADMVREHVAALGALGQAAREAGVAPPTGGVGPGEAQLLAGLQGLRGADFERAYLTQQRVAHASALATEGGYARGGSEPRLRAAAQADLPMIRAHLARLQAMTPPGR